jgi:hypothetical protein
MAESATCAEASERRICVPREERPHADEPLAAQTRDCRAEVGFSRVPELGNQRMPFEHLLHDASLDPFSAAVNQAHFPQSGLVRGADVLFDHGRNITRGERVQVESIFDWNAVGHRLSWLGVVLFLLRV